MHILLLKDIRRYIIQFQKGEIISEYVKLRRAACKGYISILSYHKEKIDNWYILAESVANGQLETAKWIYNNTEIKEINTYYITVAAARGYLDILKWFHEINHEFSNECLESASGCGHFETVIWLHENRKEQKAYYAMDNAVQNGDLNIVKWLQKNRRDCRCNGKTLYYAALHGRYDIVDWLREYRKEDISCTNSFY